MNREWEQGSLTVEATIALTVYLLIMISFVNLLLGIDVYEYINSAMCKGGCEVSFELSRNDNAIEVVDKDKIRKNIDKDYIEKMPVIDGMNGIDINMKLEGKYSDYLVMDSIYKINIPIMSVNGIGLKLDQHMVCRTFTGNQDTKSNKKFVYVTKTGSVYHTNIECTYLAIKKQKVLLSEVDSYRNSSGGKYDKCKECGKEANITGYVYITSYGTSYHNYITCSTISRSVVPIEISEINGRKKCDKCIGGER